jgi:hypothetical protein
MTKRKYFSWTDEKRAELREFIDTHEKALPQAMKEAAELFGVSVGSCNGAYTYEPKKPIVTEVNPSDLEPREGGTRKPKITSFKDSVKTHMIAKFNDMKAPEESPIIVEIGRLQDKLDEAYKQQEAMIAEVKKWIDLFPRAFTQLEFEAGEITLDDVTYHANLIYKILKHKYGHKPKLVEE